MSDATKGETVSSYDEIVKLILNKYKTSSKKTSYLLIGGCARTGKTTLTEKIIQRLKSYKIPTLHITLDDWIIGTNQRKANDTVKDRFQYVKIIDDIGKLYKGQQIVTPGYNSETRTTMQTTEKTPISLNHGICIIEGVVALDIKQLRDKADILIYTDIQKEVRIQRLEQYYLHYKGLSLEETKTIIRTREQEETPTIQKTKQYADFIFLK